MKKFTALILVVLVTSSVLSLEPVPFTVNTKKWSHVLDEHFISITINPTDLLQGKVFGLTMNSTMAILKGLAPAYVRIGSADTAKYIFKKNRHPNDKVKPEDEFTVTETHWMIFNEVIQAAGLDAIVCLNSGHRVEDTNKWDTRNSLELISFSDSQGYNLTWQLGYEVQGGENLSGTQFGKDLNRLRTILNAFPRYQHAKLIGPDIRVIHKKEDVDFWNDVLIEAGPTLDAVTWHPRWPQPSKMKVSEDSDLGYEFPIDYLEWDKVQLNKILQRSIFKNSIWIGETKRESTGTFAEGLIWARRLVLAAKLGIEVVMKQPNLMDITHPKPEYWIALLHKRLLGKAVLETRSVSNNTDLTVISHCTNSYYWTEKSEKLQDGPITVFAVNMGGSEQKIQIKGTWTGRNQLLFQYVLSSGSDPDSVFSQVTYLNGEPLMMTDEGTLPDIVPKIRKFERGLTMKLPPYSVGFWVLPEAKVKICQVQPQTFPSIKIESFTPPITHYKPQSPVGLQNIENINQFIVEKLKNPQSDSDEVKEIKVEEESLESTEKDIDLLSKENNLPRITRKIRQIKKPDNLEQLKMLMEETQNMLAQPEETRNLNVQMKHSKAPPTMEHRIYTIAEGISDAIKTTNQHHEFDKFLESAGLKQDFGSLMEADRRQKAPKMQEFFVTTPDGSVRLKRSVFDRFGSSEEEINAEKIRNDLKKVLKLNKKSMIGDEDEENRDGDKNWKQSVADPHQHDLKGLEEKYKAIIQNKLDNGKRKIDVIKKKIQLDGDKLPKKVEGATEIQEELIKKEIELISKAEETVVDILNNQKKRQETLEDLIFDELNDVKEERINALREMQKNTKKQENSITKSIHKRQVQTSLPKPFLKTVEYIEKNFNLEPETVKKIKRSLEEKMGEMLHNYDVKKSAEGKPKATYQREERKIFKKPSTEEHQKEVKKEWENELSSSKNSETDHLSKEKSYIKKPSTSSSRSHHTGSRSSKKHYSSQDGSSRRMSEVRSEEHKPGEIKRAENIAYRSSKSQEPVHKSKKFDESLNKSKKTEETSKIKKYEESKKPELFENDSFELFNNNKFDMSEKRSDRKKVVQEKEEKPVSLGKKMSIENSKPLKISAKESSEDKTQKSQQINEQENTKEKVSSEKQEPVEEEPKPVTETVSLKNDKERRMNMLKQISSMVDNMNSMESKGGRLKRMNYDEDLSDEFEPDRKPMKIHRRPRRASIIDLIGEEDVNEKNPAIPDQRIGQAKEEMEKEKLTMNNEEIIYETTEKVVAFHTTEAPITATTPPGKFSKYRNLRIRPNRRLKVTANNGEELAQKKRHLINAERPYFDLDKKKIFKPKLRKINPRFMKVENDLLKDKKTETWLKPENVPNMPQTPQTDFSTLATTEMQSKSDSEVTIIPFVQENKELMKNLEEIIEEEHFLDQTLNSVKGVSETTGKELKISGTNSKIKLADCSEENQNNFAGKTMKSTEESKVVESTPKPNKLVAENEQNFFREPTNVEEVTEASTFHMEIITKPPKIPESKVEKITEEKGSTELTHIPGIERDFEEEKDTLEKGFNIQETREKKFDWTMNEMPSGENFKPLPYSKEIHRERRATFLKNLKNKDDSVDEEDEEDYSSEERIRKFKQMLYRPSQPKKSIRNEISHTGSSTLGADQFLKMAGSTMRVMFDDVIPEAYGQTKTKIQNMGLSEYIKEFGKLVEQMRNLDQIFLNIGEAAVKGYIKSNKAEKGPYIQVISRKKRETTGEDVNLSKLDWNTEATESPPVEEPVTTNFMMTPRQELMGQIDSTTNSFLANTEPFRSNFQTLNADQTFAGNGYASPGTSETITDQYRVDWNNNRPRQGPNAMDQADVNSEKTFEFRTEPRTEMDQAIIGSEKTLETNTQMERIIQSEKKETEKTKEPEATYEMVEKLKNDVPTQQERVKDKYNPEQQGMTTQEEKALKTTELNGDEFRAYAVDRAMGNWLNSYIKEDLKETISPWLKTTKDFVQQALTTLRRQKQISEILTKDGVNLIQKQTKKNLEKRETEMNNPMLPNYHTKHIEFKPNKKRETPKPLDETLIRHLRALKPGVYVVPSEEMTNVRSEQIVNEAKDKSGMPNVVTLNIYYDKKNQDGGEKPVTVEQQQPEPRINQDPATYYQNKAWDSVAGQYDQVNQYVPATDTETTVPLSTPFVSPLQMSSVYSPHSRVTNLPNSRLIQYPSAAYHYPGAPKIVSSYSHPPSVYNPVLYVQPETTFVPQPPGTKRQWHEFKAPGSSVVSSNPNSGWHLQFGPLPSSTRKSPNTKHPITSYNANYMAATDRKRSVDEDKLNPGSTRSALPFWNFFTPSSSDGKQDFEQSMESKNREEIASDEATNSDDVKRIIEAAKKFKGNAAGAEIKESDQLEKLPQSRRKRSVDVRNENQLFPDQPVKKLSKRSSYPYHVQFKDHDILPQWLGTYQEIDNNLDDLPPHIRRSHIASTPWSGEQEELLTAILDDDDYQEELLNMDDDDYYFFNDNSLPRYRRRPRSTDNTDSKMLQTNMIYKTPIDIGSVKQKELLKPGMKKLTDRDSSLEMLSEPKMMETKTSSTEMKNDPTDNQKGTTKTDKNPTEIQQQIQNQIQQQIQLQIQHQMEQQFQQQLEQKFLQQIQNQQQQQPLSPVQSVLPLPQTLPLLTQQLIQPIPFTSQFKQNGTEMLPRTVNDDAFYYFFKYAYNSFVRVMKSMTELF